MEKTETKTNVGRPKGLPKTGGRAKGTPNKVTKDLRGIIAGFVERNAKRMQEDFDQITEPKDRLMLLEKLMQYVIPKKREDDVDQRSLNLITTDDQLTAAIKELANGIGDEWQRV